MPIHVRDVIDDEAVAYTNCQECGRLVRLAGPRLLANLGPTRPIRAVVASLTCQKCGFPGELVVESEREELAVARARRGIRLPCNFGKKGARPGYRLRTSDPSLERLLGSYGRLRC